MTLLLQPSGFEEEKDFETMCMFDVLLQVHIFGLQNLYKTKHTIIELELSSH